MITTGTIVPVGLVHVGDHVWRVQRADTGKILGRVEGTGRKWRAAASNLLANTGKVAGVRRGVFQAPAVVSSNGKVT